MLQSRNQAFVPLGNLRNYYGYYYGYGNEYAKKKIGFNKQTNGLHVRFIFWYISLSQSAKQQREMTKFKFYGLCGHKRVNF